jgi:DUF1365 family protein
VRSAIYEGVLVHRRRAPAHDFSWRIAMPLLDLAEIDQVVAQHPLWSRERTNAVSFRRGDFLGGPGTELDTAVRDLVEREVGTRPSGPIAMLAHVRTWGWLFNPIALYFCYDPSGTRVEHAIADVTNTPWKERHAYVLGAPGRHEMDKAMHVSPFFGMDQSYRIAYDAPSAALRLSISVHEGDAQVFTAAMRLRRHPVRRQTLGRVLWRYPLLTMRVSAGIHTHALRLWRKGATFHAHPSELGREVTDARPPHRAERAEEAA